MTKEEIKQLEERAYAIGSSLFPIDVFFNDIRDNKDPKYNKDRAYEDLKLIVDEIYRLKELLKEYNVNETNIRQILLGGNQAKELLDKATPKKPITKVAKGSYDPVYFHYCPVCKFSSVEKDYANFCPNCGQKLDWSDDNE